MAAQVISFAERLRAPAFRDWSRQEVAEFYRVESALLQAGLELETERGLSDEGDPWFVFCRADTGEVFIHFARCDGWYVVDGAAMGAPSRGRDFGALVRDLIAQHPLSNARRPGSNVLMHPAALLIALVGAAFFHSGRAKAAEVAHQDGAHDVRESRRGLTLNVGSAPSAVDDQARTVTLDASEVAAVLTGVAIGLRALADAPAAAASSAGDPLAAPTPVLVAAPVRDLADRGGRGSSADVLGVLSPSEVRAALTVIAVVHDLARSASIASAAVSATPAALLVADLAPRADTPAAAGAPSSGGEPNALLVVHLGSGSLPQIEALAIVAADGALARVSPDRVVQVDQLSSFLADALNHGEIVTVGSGSGSGSGGSGSDGGASTPADPSAVGADHNPLPAAQLDGHAHASSVKVLPADASTVAASSHVTGGDAATPSSTLTPPSISTPTPLSALSSQPDHPAAPDHSAYIDNAVIAFVTAVSDVKVVIAGSEVVFYDPQILAALPIGETLDSITWRLGDGSSVSLVGTATELHAFHGLG